MLGLVIMPLMVKETPWSLNFLWYCSMVSMQVYRPWFGWIFPKKMILPLNGRLWKLSRLFLLMRGELGIKNVFGKGRLKRKFERSAVWMANESIRSFRDSLKNTSFFISMDKKWHRIKTFWATHKPTESTAITRSTLTFLRYLINHISNIIAFMRS